jgi:hypothetical protein
MSTRKHKLINKPEWMKRWCECFVVLPSNETNNKMLYFQPVFIFCKERPTCGIIMFMYMFPLLTSDRTASDFLWILHDCQQASIQEYITLYNNSYYCVKKVRRRVTLLRNWFHGEGLFWKVYSCSAGQKNSHFPWNPNIHYSSHKILPLNPVHRHTPYMSYSY